MAKIARIVEHRCVEVVLAAAEHCIRFARDHHPKVERGPFGLSVHGFPEHPQLYPSTTEDADHRRRQNAQKEIYIPFGTHCPYCGDEIEYGQPDA